MSLYEYSDALDAGPAKRGWAVIGAVDFAVRVVVRPRRVPQSSYPGSMSVYQEEVLGECVSGSSSAHASCLISYRGW
jgi:hypothetical protein